MRMSGYPETVVVSSQGPAAEMFPLAMGVYTMTDVTHSDRPVWRGRNGTLLGPANEDVIQSNKTSFLSIPQTGWKYRDDAGWQDDDDSLMISGLD